MLERLVYKELCTIIPSAHCIGSSPFRKRDGKGWCANVEQWEEWVPLGAYGFR